MDGQREARKKETANSQMEKKYEHLKLLTMPRSILFYKNDKNIVKKIKITKLRQN